MRPEPEDMRPEPFDKLRTAPFDKLRTAPVEGRASCAWGADARDLRLDRLEEGLANAESRMLQGQHCRTHQAVRSRNHSILAGRGDELSLEAGWRSQHAVDDDAAADHDRARRVRCPYGGEQVCERR